MLFELIYRRPGDEDVVFASWEHHFEPLGGGEFTAQPFEASADVDAFVWAAGDQLIFRYTGSGTDTPMAYVPNGEGPDWGGRYPYIDLP